MSSKFIIDNFMPKYASANSFLNNNINNNHSNPSIVSQTSHNIHNNSEGSPALTGSEEGSSPPSTTTTIASSYNSANKMYPFVSNHPTTHSSYPTMPGFTGLDDKSCG